MMLCEREAIIRDEQDEESKMTHNKNAVAEWFDCRLSALAIGTRGEESTLCVCVCRCVL